MTVAQRLEFSQRSRRSVRELPKETEHDALNETATMSSYGPTELPPIATTSNDRTPHDRHKASATAIRDAQTQTSEILPGTSLQTTRRSSAHTVTSRDKAATESAQRVEFGQFVEQLRQQQYFENKKLLLQQRKRLLEKTITLSARLHRVSSWIGDGLVEISEQPDTAGFVRLHQHTQNLIDLSYSQWDSELHALDPLGKANNCNVEDTTGPDVFSKLSNNAKADLFDLLSYLRSNPRFLVERFKVLAPSQIVSLWSAPRFHRFPDATQSEHGSFVNARGKLSSQRIQAYSKVLEDYASSFERSNPLAFLLFNMFGTNQSSLDAENQLRLSTWSTVCAELMLTSKPAFHALVLQLLDCFASLYEWQAKESVEMFLMDILQRGAFLLDQTTYNTTSSRVYGRLDQTRTPQAQEFFDTAVQDLFAIFVKFDGGFPTGALQFASAVLGKLPLLEQQMEFRGIFFSKWFLEHFLQLTISYPENENMLLQFHVSNNARQKILRPLWVNILDRVHDVYNAFRTRDTDPDFKISVDTIVSNVDLVESPNPYAKPEIIDNSVQDNSQASFTISVSEIVQALEALSPQAMHGARSDHYLFDSGSIYGQYVQASGRFDRLKTDLIFLLEPGSSVTDVHPCQEQWLQIDIDKAGKPMWIPKMRPDVAKLTNIKPDCLDNAQEAALRLFTDQMSDCSTNNGMSYRSDLLKTPSLEELFRKMESFTFARLDPIGCLYWTKATDTLVEKYPLSVLVKDDSAVLQSMFMASKAAQASCSEYCSKLEIQMSLMEDVCLKIRSTINKCVDRFESLRLKIWYSVDVVLSKHYDDAKNISRALNNMATSTIGNLQLSGNSLSSRPTSSASSLFDQPFEDTMNIMKAPAAHGGPKKLADKQIELTRNWLDHTHVENFCKGEERIHRFCMQIYTVSRSLVGETLSESPVLWASDLFTRERSLFDIRQYSVTSAPASTRPASIMSDTFSTSYRATRTIPRSAESLRMALLDDRRPNGPSRINRDCLPPELASSIGSLSRAHSATTAESISSVFTPISSNTRSLTSASIYSRSASIFNDPSLSRFTDTVRAKTKFLDKVRQVVICLLLSDLGCPVWSLGSETDAMLNSSRCTPAVDRRLQQRMTAEALAGEIRSTRGNVVAATIRSRSQSVFTTTKNSWKQNMPDMNNDQYEQQQHDFGDTEVDDHLYDLSELLRKLSQQVDPMGKLNIVEEFYNLSLTTLKSERPVHDGLGTDSSSINTGFRRLSLDDQALRPLSQPRNRDGGIKTTSVTHASVNEIIQHLKSDLARIPPRTLFRDLQYISAFVPPESTDNTPHGKALLQLGLAALAYKDEVCRSMVDVADRMFSQIPELRGPPPELPKIVELWIFAAREGNPVAQRELALLYLSRPELLPVTSSPLSKTSDIFKSDMLWHERNNHNANTQALCLAMHWMQQASANGDGLAKQKLEERRRGTSIR